MFEIGSKIWHTVEQINIRLTMKGSDMSLWRKVVVCLCVLFGVSGALAELRIDVTGAVSEPLPIAIPYFSGSGPAAEMTDIITADLERSGLFRLVNREAYIQQITGANDRPRFADWQAVQAHALLHGQVEQGLDGQMKVSFRLWDVFAQRPMEAKVMAADPAAWRKLAHIVADTVYERITGETGYFDSQIVFVSESGDQKHRVKRLAVMDQDGAGFKYLSDGKEMALTPRFSPNMQKIAYFSYKNGDPKVYLMDLQTGETELVGRFDGMSFAPRFSPDGTQLVMSLARQGNSDIYLYDLRTRTQKRLTNHPAIDTTPSFSPDGKKLVFSSDRSGNQQLYLMDKDGSGVKRISFGEGTYATPVWSPRGDYIAFTKIKAGQFHIGVMRPDGSGERLIANGFLVEGPTWAPNGRVLAFFKQIPWDQRGKNGGVRLYSIDVTGHNEQVFETPEDGSSPAWSPLLH